MAQEPEDHDVATAVGYLLVATGHGIPGRTVLLPGSVVERVDHASQVVHVTCSKEQIRAAPQFRDDEYHRGELLDYYRLMPPGPAGRI